MWQAAESLRYAVRAAGVPSEPSAYVLSVVRSGGVEVVYIGKAGTIRSDGSWKKQSLRGRLHAKQKRVSRQEYFRRQLVAAEADSLEIQWFVTWDTDIRLAPAFAEAELLQAFLTEFRRLPAWNEAF